MKTYEKFSPKVKYVTAEYKGKMVTTDTLYRYIINDDNTIEKSVMKIKWINNLRISFEIGGGGIFTSNINTIINSKVLYLPVDDIDLAKQIFIEYYEKTIKNNKDKILELTERIVQLEDKIKLLQ